MKIVGIHQPQYVPYWGFFDKIARCDVFVMLDHVQFMKNGLQNRNKIKGPQGWQWLTVPVSQTLHQRISDVTIMDPKWRKKHLGSLQSSYGRAKHFKWCAEAVFPLLEREWTHLSPLNIALQRAVCDLLRIQTPIVFSSALAPEGEQSEMLVNLCKAVGADTYLSGPGGKGYMDLERFARSGIDVAWQSFEHPVYEQVFPDVGFEANLSILDVLFCAGPGVANLLDRPAP